MLMLVCLILLFVGLAATIFIPHMIRFVLDIKENLRVMEERKEGSVYSSLDSDTFPIPTAIMLIIIYAVCMTSLILLFTWVTIYNNKPYKQTEEMQSKKVNIEYKLSYYDKLFFDYVDEAKQYNQEVNRTNNKKIRFKVEDRTEYMIDIDYYITEFYNNKTTTS